MSLPPPFGSSEEFQDRQILEAITLVVFICGVPAVILAAVVTVVVYYYFGKTIYNKCNRLPRRDGGKEAIPILIFILGLPMIGITWLAVVAVILAIVIAGVGLVLAAVVLCLIPFVIVSLLYCCCTHKLRQPPANTSVRLEPLLEQNHDHNQHDHNQPEQKWLKCILMALDEYMHTSALIKPLFSSVTMRFGSEEEPGQKVDVLYAERKDPEDPKWKVWVRVYFLTAAVLAIFWFLAIFIDNLWYRKVTTCNDVNVNSNNYICYSIDRSGEVDDDIPVNCMNENDPDDVLCYILIYSPGMALGIAVGVARFILFVTDLAFNITLWLGDREWGRVLLVTVQLLASFGSLAFLVVIPVVQVGAGKDINFFKWFLHGRIVGRVFIFALTSITITVVPLVPWWAFQGAPEYKDISKKN